MKEEKFFIGKKGLSLGFDFYSLALDGSVWHINESKEMPEEVEESWDIVTYAGEHLFLWDWSKEFTLDTLPTFKAEKGDRARLYTLQLDTERKFRQVMCDDGRVVNFKDSLAGWLYRMENTFGWKMSLAGTAPKTKLRFYETPQAGAAEYENGTKFELYRKDGKRVSVEDIMLGDKIVQGGQIYTVAEVKRQ